MDENGLRSLLAGEPEKFGKPAVELTGKTFSRELVIRCRPSKHDVMPWPHQAILRIDHTKLNADQWCCGGLAGDHFVLGTAAAKFGKLLETELRAYEIWENRGRPIDDDWADWFTAERELRIRWCL